MNDESTRGSFREGSDLVGLLVALIFSEHAFDGLLNFGEARAWVDAFQLSRRRRKQGVGDGSEFESGAGITKSLAFGE